jgi:hypothetical protein
MPKGCHDIGSSQVTLSILGGAISPDVRSSASVNVGGYAELGVSSFAQEHKWIIDGFTTGYRRPGRINGCTGTQSVQPC